MEHIGFLTTGYDPILPGSGVGKVLPPVGDIHLSGIVNLSGFMPLMLLQCTRLALVYHMAELTAQSILYVCSRPPLKPLLYQYA